MKLLIDTHIFLWFIEGDSRLRQKEIQIIELEANEVYVSTASLWEIAIKMNIGKLRLSVEFDKLQTILIRNKFYLLDLKFQHYSTLIKLPLHHQDPFDRIIVAQSKAERLHLISRDDKLHLY